ncbi:MAG: 1-acyl-sn-glycerol-3-phosphate acyltransferase [Planctomycetes bacterium]|nr:1-acyl-sn-glycerol-3-phosphate acyltransferase [Planctomycetota bacterium]
MIYLLLRALLRHALRVFFRDVAVEGRSDVPAEGPLLLAANHPNTLMDVLLVATALDRRVGFVAKAPLFRSPFLGPILRFFGAVPVERRQEGPLDDAARARNEAALRACEDAVATGGAVLIFPEGVSQDEPRLMPLKTGLARIALAAEARAPGQVHVVPVALVYDDPGTFRSRARVRFGQPLQVAPFARLSDAEPEPFQAARALTTAVREALLPGVVHVEHSEHDPLVRDLARVYGHAVAADAGGPLAAVAAISRAVNAFAATDPARVERVRGLLTDYCGALERAGVDDRVVRAHQARPPSRLEDLGFALGAPLALWGIVNHLVFYNVPRLVMALVTPESVFASTVKLVSGLAALVACYAVQTWLVARHLGAPAATAYLGTLPLTGVIALLWLEGLAARARARRARREQARLDAATRADLLARRAAVLRELDAARADFLATAAPD